jgi:hypothetical protein
MTTYTNLACECSPQTPEELFNLRHAQLRNVIERIFGVLKRQFHLLVSRPEFTYEQQALIVGAAAALHNFLRIHSPINDMGEDEDYDVEGDPFFAGGPDIEAGIVYAIETPEKKRADTRRDRIANAMWTVYVRDHPDLQ